MSNLDELMDKAPTLAVFDSFIITDNKLKNPCYKNISASISGGADSDIVLDILTKLDTDKKVHYVFFNTGLEYQATKDHIKYLENKYGIEIKVENALKPIPISCREYGLPFLSKRLSDYIERLQRHGFKWEDKPLDELLKEYPKCKVALRWWCNDWGEGSRFNISYSKGLKEFMIANPPTFKVSNKCCYYAKKKVAHTFNNNNDIDLSIYGVRKAEGGTRATAYKNCFTSGKEKDKADEYRIIFWYKDEDKKAYEETFDVTHSRCYTEYGLLRTGCAGCPFGRDFEEELKVIETYEPKLYKAVNNIFGDSYEYTRKYREFVANMKNNKQDLDGQMSIFDYEDGE